MRRWLMSLGVGTALLLPAIWCWSEDAIAPSNPTGSPDSKSVNFERDVQPILVSRCQTCHGRETQKAGLRLDRREAAVAELKSGERAIVAGNPDESELLRRVASTDADERMPPKGEPLSAAQVETLRRWIVSGAEWPDHWAYRPLRKPEPPRFASPDDEAWCRTPIDRFVLTKLREHGLTPSAPAEKRILLRRTFFDLTGLPPTPEDVAAFLADGSPDAFERVVDRLLASPRYGERWARHWMDVVHFAETHGHDQDRPRDHAWPYRDYLIRSFNDGKPYARFVAEQIAGDILHPNDAWATAATGFLAAGPWDESSLRDIRDDTLDREIARSLDRDDIVTSVVSTFASTTVHCARCHDHKFDPITQQDYFALQAVFAATDKGNRAVDFDPQAAARRRQLTEWKSGLAGRQTSRDPSLLDAALQAEVAAWGQATKESATQWQTLDPVEFKAAEGSTLTKQLDGSLLASGQRPEKDTYTIVARTELPNITAVRLEVLTDDSLPMKGPGRQDNGNLHLNEFVVKQAPGGDVAAAKPVAIESASADFNQEAWTIAHAIDGNAGTAWGVFPKVGQPHRAVFRLKEPIRRGDEAHATLVIELQQTHGRGHLIGRPKLSITSASNPAESDTLPTAIVDILKLAPADRTEAQRIELTVFYLGQKWDRELASLPKPQLVYSGSNQFQPDGGFKPSPKPRPIHVLKRGDVRNPLEPATPGTVSCLPDLANRFTIDNADDEGARRVALAKWMTDPRNGLTWRSIVNRVWHYHFGRGLVDTPNDFGLMGSPPSHPELLDWLAVTLQEQGGSLKQLHRLIVTSAVYQQSSGNADFRFPNAELKDSNDSTSIRQSEIGNRQSTDSDNRFLWRMNRQRLDAESIRDAVLQVSGKLDLKMAGPSVRQFNMSPGIHVTPNVDYLNFNVDDVSNHRRSVYRFLFRSLPDPLMDSLDCPDGSQLTPVRSASVTALQALALLNDKLIVRQSEHIAERIVREQPDPTRQVPHLYRLVLGREPSPAEADAVGAYVALHGLANGCRVLLNSNEFVFVD
ncbi:MAG: PSD1 domain-containing protein [Planctomycetales bacterium]|nr:PSD1 domain-containing protein [Planctomycetales bacterium]